MGFVGFRHKDKDVLKWARYYTSRHTTLMEMEEKFGIQHSTLYWVFLNRLPELDVELYDAVLITIAFNKTHKPVRKYRKGASY